MCNFEPEAYQLAMKNTKYNQDGKAVISKNDEWREESEWEDLFEQMKKERVIQKCITNILGENDL